MNKFIFEKKTFVPEESRLDIPPRLNRRPLFARFRRKITEKILLDFTSGVAGPLLSVSQRLSSHEVKDVEFEYNNNIA